MKIGEIFKEGGSEKLELKIKRLKLQEELLKSSAIFLLEKINELKNNGKLEDYEIDFIKKQIEYHKKLAVLKQKLLRETEILTKESKKGINDIFNRVKGKQIGEIELSLLRIVIEQKINKRRILLSLRKALNSIYVLGRDKKRYIDYLLKKGDITKDQLLQKSEKYKAFNYLDFMDQYGLSEEIERVYMEMITKKMIGLDVYVDGKVIKITSEFIEKNKAIIINNLMILNKIIVGIESDGINKDNNNQSGAKGYFQFHTANGSDNRKKGKFNSFETALRRNYLEYSGKKYIPNLRLPNDHNVPKWIIEAYNKKNSDPKELTTIQQNSLFVIDMFNNGRTVLNAIGHEKGIPDYIGLVIIGNLWSAEKFYEFFHHTAPDKATKRRIKYYSMKYSKELIKIN